MLKDCGYGTFATGAGIRQSVSIVVVATVTTVRS